MPDPAALIQTYGYGALFLGTLLEGETVLILAGLLAHMGLLKLPLVVLVALLGSFLGDQFFFFLGRRRGVALLDNRPRWQRRAQKVHQILGRHRLGIMLGFRFVYGMRVMTPLILGTDRTIPVRQFALLNLAGASLWSVGVGAGGYFFGRFVKGFLEGVRHYELGLLLAVLLAGVVLRSAAALRERRRP